MYCEGSFVIGCGVEKTQVPLTIGVDPSLS